jgi:hypothetical protein
VALEGALEVKLWGGQGEVLSDPPAYPHDLPSVHREKGRKSHDPQAQDKVVAMGQAGWPSQEEMSTFSEHTENKSEKVEARDGVEPPTPAFSVLRYAVF